AWFFGTMRWWSREKPAVRERIGNFHELTLKPVDFAAEEGANSDNLQSRLLGLLALCYGGFISLLALIPNPLTGRLGFLFCGGVVIIVGLALRRAARARPASS